MSAEIQESMSNFRVIVAFNRLDYFRQKFDEANERNFAASVSAGLANNIFVPLYGLAFNLAQLIVLAYGFYLIAAGSLTVGLLIGFLLYVNSFYMPLRQLAAVWSSFQLALAGLDRISDVLALESNMPQLPPAAAGGPAPVLAFEHVHFSYPGGSEVLQDAHVRARARQDLRAGRADRRRQDDDGVADGAALRSDRRTRAARRPGHPLVSRRKSARERSASSCRSRSSSPARSATTSCTATTRYQTLCRRAARRRCWRRGISTACSRASSRGSRRR